MAVPYSVRPSFKSKLIMILLVLVPTFALVTASEINLSNVPPYIKQCHEGDPELIKCFIQALHHLSPYLATGIKEIELPSVEPFRMDELSLSLTGGPNGYKISLKDMDVFGASNFTVQRIKLSENNKPFETRIKIPLMKINARYTSSGVLLIIPASGNGTFSGQFGDVIAKVRGTVSSSTKNSLRYLKVETLAVDIDIKTLKMAVKNIYRNNKILEEAINLFLRDNGYEVFKIMNPQLGRKLAVLFKEISNKLLTHVPVDVFYVPKSSQ